VGLYKIITMQLSLKPNYAKAYVARGFARIKLNKKEEALEDFNKAIEFDPTLALAYWARGLTKIVFGQNDSGCLDLSIAAEMGESNAHDLINKWCKK